MICQAVLHLGNTYAWHRRRSSLWLALVTAVTLLLGLHAVRPEWGLLPALLDGQSGASLPAVLAAALQCEYIGSALGMG